MKKGIQTQPGDADAGDQIVVTNRTGGAFVAAEVVIRDFIGSATESTTPTQKRGNVVDPVTANLAQKAVICLDDTADDTTGLVQFDGPVLAKVEGTTDIAAGDGLVAVNGQNYLVKAAAGGFVQAIALEAFTTNGTGTIEVLLLSEGYYLPDGVGGA